MKDRLKMNDSLDTAFWQAIKDRDFAIPPGYTVELLTERLLAALGNPDRIVREGPNFEVLEAWIHREVYSDDALRAMIDQMLRNLTTGLGEVGTDTVFLRTFSMLILTEILHEDNKHPFLAETEVRDIMKRGLSYLAAEQDLRGYIEGKGWAHALAHTADFLMTLTSNRYLLASDLERLLRAIADKLIGPTSCVYLYEEDERLSYAVLSALRRNLLEMPFLTAWIMRLARPTGASWPIETFTLLEQTWRYYNLKAFLRSLYFQLHVATSAPQSARELLSLLEEAIRAMDRGYYALP